MAVVAVTPRLRRTRDRAVSRFVAGRVCSRPGVRRGGGVGLVCGGRRVHRRRVARRWSPGRTAGRRRACGPARPPARLREVLGAAHPRFEGAGHGGVRAADVVGACEGVGLPAGRGHASTVAPKCPPVTPRDRSARSLPGQCPGHTEESARAHLDDDRTCAYSPLSLFDAACVQAPSERGAGRDAGVRGSPRLPNSPSHRALQRRRL